MQAYVIRRVLLAIPTFLTVTAIVFLLLRFIPGGVIDMMMADMESSQTDRAVTEASIREILGLDVPVHIQYGRWMGFLPHLEGGFSGILQGNLGNSLWTGQPINDELTQRIPVSLELGSLALLTAVLVALPIGIYSAIRQDTIGDYASRTFAILAISLPGFWLGTMVVVYPSIWWGYMPPLKYFTLVQDPLENLRQFIVPAVILGMAASGTLMRMTRTMMLEVLRQDYIRTAWSKGLTENTVILRHALKNALIPVATILGLQLPILISGSVIMEQIFVLPGMGRLLIFAVQQRDYPVISAINVIIAAFVLVLNLVVDLTYTWLDPRVKYR